MKLKIIGGVVLAVLAVAMLLTLVGTAQNALAEQPSQAEAHPMEAANSPEADAAWKLICPFH